MWRRVDCTGQRTRAAAIVVAALVPACFGPTYGRLLCSAEGECPTGMMCMPQAAGPSVCQPPGIQPGGSPDAPLATPDAPVVGDAGSCTTGVVDGCGLPAPSTAFDVATAASLNTDSDVRCQTVSQAGRDLCLIYATEVTIASTGALTVTGGRPLALVSAATMVIQGAIDAGSHGTQIGPAADDPSCAFGSNPDNDLGGGGGGAGGSFTLTGGNGGTGDTDSGMGGDGVGTGGTHGAVVSAPVLRGGCRGQKGGDEQPGGFVGGAGGHAGGALYLAARQSASVTGSIRATGAGGGGGQAQGGGGGGGSGGMVVIESPSITISGQISANGGGGGQGGGRVGVDDVTGISGSDGTFGTTPAAGGFGANNNDNRFSTGGPGSAGTTAAAPGTDSVVGGGGGGGAAGVIRLLGTASLAGSTISPPPS